MFLNRAMCSSELSIESPHRNHTGANIGIVTHLCIVYGSECGEGQVNFCQPEIERL